MKVIVEIPDYTISDIKQEQLRMHRILAGISVSAVAKKAKVSKQFISAMEKGGHKCPKYILNIYRNMKLRSGIPFGERQP